MTNEVDSESTSGFYYKLDAIFGRMVLLLK